METSSELQAAAESGEVKSNTKISIKERIKLVLKFALVGVVFYYLYRKGLVTGASFSKLFHSPFAMLMCLFLIGLNTLLGALRWQVLLRTQGAELPFGRVLNLNLIGAFFNIALPGAVSGDFVKAVYVAKEFKDKRAAVFGSMLFDRLLGASAMIFVGAFSALLSCYLNWGGQLPPMLLYSVGGVGFVVVLFFVYLFCSHRKDPLFSILQFFTRRHIKLSAVDRLYHGVMGYRAYPTRVMKGLLLSVAIHILLVLMAFFITEAIAPSSVSLIAMAVIVPTGLLATTVPVLPAGVGTGHAAFYALFHMVGSNLGAEVFSLIVVYQVLVALVGGVVYLRLSSEKR